MIVVKNYQYIQPTYILRDVNGREELYDFIMSMIFKRNIDYRRLYARCLEDGYTFFGENEYYLRDPKDRERELVMMKKEAINLADHAYRNTNGGEKEVMIEISFGDLNSGNSYDYRIYIERKEVRYD